MLSFTIPNRSNLEYNELRNLGDKLRKFSLLTNGMLHDELINSVLEFLELAIHITLWSRRLYAADLFERVKYCGFNARKSRHPGINTYISSTVGNLKVITGL
jgi:hypothetical protein